MSPDGTEKLSNKSLRHLAELPGTPPATTAGKVLWAWPQITAALERGWRLCDVWSALRKDGIEMPYVHFRVYVYRIRQRLARKAAAGARPGSVVPLAPVAPAKSAPPAAITDPYASAREQRKRKREYGFEYDPFSNNKNLLE
jgi:hypothetical protein